MTLEGIIIQAGDDAVSGLVLVTIETTMEQLRDLTISPYGKKCRVEIYVPLTEEQTP